MKPQVKKEWKTPELIVLVRSKPEEAVLGVCKISDTAGSGPSGSFDFCYAETGGICDVCSVLTTS